MREAFWMSPPRSRGSAQGRSPEGHGREVSPALAGIGPERRPSGSSRTCLPRARGDRPDAARLRLHVFPSPPRSRGSAPRRLRAAWANLVSPALAGIGRCLRCLPWRALCLPRARGDRPLTIAKVELEELSPPRSRGSAAVGREVEASEDVSPALAGIGPSP